MSDSVDPLKAAFDAKDAAETKRRAEAAQQADEVNGILQKWGSDLAAALDLAAATISSLTGSSTHEVEIDGAGAVLTYVRPGADFELTVEARAICGTTSSPGIKGHLILVGDPHDDDQPNRAILDVTLHPNHRGPVTGSCPYGLQPLGRIVSVDPVGFGLFLTTLAS